MGQHPGALHPCIVTEREPVRAARQRVLVVGGAFGGRHHDAVADLDHAPRQDGPPAVLRPHLDLDAVPHGRRLVREQPLAALLGAPLQDGGDEVVPVEPLHDPAAHSWVIAGSRIAHGRASADVCLPPPN